MQGKIPEKNLKLSPAHEVGRKEDFAKFQKPVEQESKPVVGESRTTERESKPSLQGEPSPGSALIGQERKLDRAWNSFLERQDAKAVGSGEESQSVASSMKSMGQKLSSFLFQTGGVFSEGAASPSRISDNQGSSTVNSPVFQSGTGLTRPAYTGAMMRPEISTASTSQPGIISLNFPRTLPNVNIATASLQITTHTETLNPSNALLISAQKPSLTGLSVRLETATPSLSVNARNLNVASTQSGPETLAKAGMETPASVNIRNLTLSPRQTVNETLTVKPAANELSVEPGAQGLRLNAAGREASARIVPNEESLSPGNQAKALTSNAGSVSRLVTGESDKMSAQLSSLKNTLDETLHTRKTEILPESLSSLNESELSGKISSLSLSGRNEKAAVDLQKGENVPIESEAMGQTASRRNRDASLEMKGRMAESENPASSQSSAGEGKKQDEALSQIDRNMRLLERLSQQQSPGIIPSPLTPDASFSLLPISQSSIWEALMLIWKSYLSATQQGSLPAEYLGSKMLNDRELYRKQLQEQMAYSQQENISGEEIWSAFTDQQKLDELRKERLLREALKKDEREAVLPYKQELSDKDKKKSEESSPDDNEEQKTGDRERGGGQKKREQEEEEQEEQKGEEEKDSEGDRERADGESPSATSGASPGESREGAGDREDIAASEGGKADLLRYPSHSDELEGYYPCWNFSCLGPESYATLRENITGAFDALREKNRIGDRNESRFEKAAFPLFAQIYAESTSPLDASQAPPPHQSIPFSLLSGHMVQIQDIMGQFTLRASRFASSAIEDILKKKHKLSDIKKDYFAAYIALFLRISGEFTLSHSLRVMDLALDLATSSNIHDRDTLEQIRLGCLFKDIGELDYLMSRLPTGKRESIANFVLNEDMRWAGVLHDVGKIRIPREILYKPGALTDEEFKIMKMHPIFSERILFPVLPLRFLCPVVRAHHERWDGKGYPDGLKEDSIPVAARIIAIADVFDALISDRPYKKGMPWEKVRRILTEGRGTHFAPDFLDTFIESIAPLYE